MDLNLIKFAYKNNLYCCVHGYSSYTMTYYIDDYYLIYLKEECKDYKDEDLNVFSFGLRKHSFSQGMDYTWKEVTIHPNKLSWNEHFIDDKKIPSNLYFQYAELINNEEVYIFGENIYKLKKDCKLEYGNYK